MLLKTTLCLAAACMAVAVNGEEHVDTVVHPCVGRKSRLASILDDCKSFWRCFEDPPTIDKCPNGTLFHDEQQTCVLPENQNCFECNSSISYRLRSVHAACYQYAMCFNGRASLHKCPSWLVFDGRPGIRSCNRRDVGCNRENGNDQDEQPFICPNVHMTQPLFFRAPNSCSRYTTHPEELSES